MSSNSTAASKRCVRLAGRVVASECVGKTMSFWSFLFVRGCNNVPGHSHSQPRTG